MFCLPDIQTRRKLLGGPLSHRQYNNNLFLKLATPTPPLTNESDPKLLKLTARRTYQTRRSSLNQTSLSMLNHEKQRPSALSTHRTTTNKQGKILPYVTVFLGDLIMNYEQVREKIVVLDLEKYFEAFFKKDLKGEFTASFYSIVDRYLRQLDEASPSGVKTAHNISLPIELLQLTTKQDFVNAIRELEKKNELQLILDTIKYFCLPSQ